MSRKVLHSILASAGPGGKIYARQDAEIAKGIFSGVAGGTEAQKELLPGKARGGELAATPEAASPPSR